MEIEEEGSLNSKITYKLSAQDSYIKGDPVIINFTIQNLSIEDLWVLKWYTPLEGLKGKIFRVTCDGREIPYEGPMHKRGDPEKADYIHIRPRRSVTAQVDLSTVYNFPASEKCQVWFKGRIYDISLTNDILPKSNEEQQMVSISGNSVTFRIID
jgi:hypothetical protein